VCDSDRRICREDLDASQNGLSEKERRRLFSEYALLASIERKWDDVLAFSGTILWHLGVPVSSEAWAV
jgi:hypothetical protein